MRLARSSPLPSRPLPPSLSLTLSASSLIPGSNTHIFPLPHLYSSLPTQHLPLWSSVFLPGPQWSALAVRSPVSLPPRSSMLLTSSVRPRAQAAGELQAPEMQPTFSCAPELQRECLRAWLGGWVMCVAVLFTALSFVWLLGSCVWRSCLQRVLHLLDRSCGFLGPACG